MRLGILAAGVALVWAGGANADPCEGRLPRPGTAFAGIVRYVGDGDSLCVGTTPDRQEWIEIRLSDFYAPELHEAGGENAKHALETLTFGRTLTCVAGRRSYDRVVASCRLAGAAVGDLLRQRGVREGGRGL